VSNTPKSRTHLRAQKNLAVQRARDLEAALSKREKESFLSETLRERAVKQIEVSKKQANKCARAIGDPIPFEDVF